MGGTLVLVGGTGSLCSEILKQQDVLKENQISRIRIISRDEVKQDITEKNYKGEIELQCFLGDVRNAERMEFALKGAQYVIHAAALKFIERFELDVGEGFLTNITGSQNVAKAAFLHKLYGALLVSTDKASAPINAYGVSKLAASHYWQWCNTFQKHTKFCIAAWGNVWNSRGSVIEKWHIFAKEKKPLPITHWRMTRFFITKRNAARFVLDSLFKNNRSMNTPKMKSAEMVRVAELINKFYGSEAGIEVVGLRDKREKLHEDLINGENAQSSLTAERFSDEEILEMIAGN